MKKTNYKTLIIDDEKHCRSALIRSIKKCCSNLTVIADVCSVEEARVVLSRHNVDLIFLDVEMPEESGFDLMEQLEFNPIPTIFTTAHEGYALKALKKQAVDYLLKPIDHKELITAVDKLNRSNEVSDKQLQKVAFPTLNGLQFIDPVELVRCQAEGAYTRLFMLEGAILVSKNIGYVEKLLKGYNFYRIHKSHLINLSHVAKYIKGKGGVVIMSDNTEVGVSKRKREDFLLAICH